MGDVVERLGLLEQIVLEAAARALPPADGLAIAGAARTYAAVVLSAEAPDGLVARRFVAAALVHLALAHVVDPSDARELLGELPADERLEARIGALTHLALTALPLPEALVVLSGLLTAVAGVIELSAWRTDLVGHVIRVHQHGPASPADAASALAERCLVERAPVIAGGLFATPVMAFGGPSAALVWRIDEPDAALAHVLVGQAAVALSAPLQHALTADDNLDAHRALVKAPERRLTRLALDLHDGALQDAALVAGELRRLEDELRPALRGSPAGEQVRGTLETLASLVEALDADLREVATSIEGPTMLRRPFTEALQAVVAAFRSRSQIEAVLELSGDLDAITDAQRVTLFRVVQESLANVRQHAGADAVAITVAGFATHLECEVIDDGVGFELESVAAQATRSGRLGLVGMVERVRLLGGRCDITSRPGDGTSVRVRLARYEPPPERTA